MVTQAMVIKRWKENGINLDEQALNVISDTRINLENLSPAKPNTLKLETRQLKEFLQANDMELNLHISKVCRLLSIEPF